MQYPSLGRQKNWYHRVSTLIQFSSTLYFNKILGKKLARDDPMLPQVIAMEKKYCQGLTGAGDGMLLDMMPWLRHLGNSSYKTLMEAVDIREKLWGKYIPELKVCNIWGLLVWTFILMMIGYSYVQWCMILTSHSPLCLSLMPLSFIIFAFAMRKFMRGEKRAKLYEAQHFSIRYLKTL